MIKYPKITESKIISEQSESLLYKMFPPDSFNIIKIHMENDYGLDYKIEIIKQKQVLGYEFYVQLKGLKELRNKISINISISTLNYWKSKIIPILIIAIDCKNKKGYATWFNKNLKIKQNQNSQSILLNKRDELTPNKIEIYIEAYYLGFIESIRERKIYSYYKHLFYNSVLMSTAIDNKFIAFLYPPKLTKEQLEKHNKFYMESYIKIFAKFIYDLKIYQTKLPKEPIHLALNEFVVEFQKIHKQICVSETKNKFSKGEVYEVTVNAEKAHYYLPILSRMFSEMNLFFITYFLRYNTFDYEQTYICEEKK